MEDDAADDPADDERLDLPEDWPMLHCGAMADRLSSEVVDAFGHPRQAVASRRPKA